MTAFIPTRKQALRTFVLLGLLLLVIYGKSLPNAFVDWDDKLLIVENPIVHEFSSETVKQAFTTYDPELYIPLTLVSYQINHLVSGLNPFSYHLVNLLIHALNAALIAWFVLLLCGKRWVAAVTALLFAVHPLHTEAVVWASSRKDVLAAFFFLCTLIGYLLYRKTGEKSWYRRSIVALLLALLSKVVAFTAPVVLLLIDWREGRKIDKANLKEKLPYFALSIIFGLVAIGGKHGNDDLLFSKLLVGCKAIVFYTWKLIFPTGLSVLYPFTQSSSLTNPNLLIPFIIVILISILAWCARKKSRDILFGWLFFLVTVAPTFTNFAKGQDFIKDIYFASDRYAYIPSIGLLFLAALFFHSLLKKNSRSVQGTVAALIILLSFQAHAQSLTWKNTESLFTNVLTHYPNSHLAHNNLGSLRFREEKYDEAFEYYQNSIAIRPNSMAYYNLGQFYIEMQQPEKALEAYQNAFVERPSHVDILVNLGALEMRVGTLSNAVEYLIIARDLDPSIAIIHYNLGVAYGKQGKGEDALASFKKVLEIDPNNKEVQEFVRKLGG